MGQRIIEHDTDLTLRSDDYILKDSATNDTKKITPEAFVEGALDNYLAEYVSGLDSTSASSDSDIFYTVVDGVQKKVSKSTILSADRTARATAEGTIASNFAQEYSTITQYAVGDYCIKDLVLYKCTSPTSGTWDSSKWMQVTALDLTSGVASDLADEIEARQSADETLQGEIDELPVDVQVDGGSLVNEDNIAVLDSLVAYGEASGEIATFSDGSYLAMKSLKVAIEPVQDLHGYNNPWVGGSTKNKLPVNIVDSTSSGITIHVQEDGGIKITGTNSSSSTASFTLSSSTVNQCYLPQGNNVISSSGLVEGLNIEYSGNGQNGVVYSYINSSATSRTMSVQDATKPFNYITLSVGGNRTINTVIYLQIEQGTTPTSYVPYSNICPISGWSSVNVVRDGVNLFDKTTITRDKILNRTYGTPTNNEGSYVSDYIPITNGTFKFSVAPAQIGIYDKNKTFNRILETGADTLVINDSNDKFIRFSRRAESFVSIDADIQTMQLEVGNQATAYEPYNGQTYTIDLDGTRYGGTLDVVSGVLTITHGYLKLTDTDYNWQSGIWGGGYRYYTTNRITDAKNNQSCQSSIYKAVTRLTEEKGIAISTAGNTNQIDVRTPDFTSLANWKSFLASNPVDVVYLLATPITIQLTPTQVKSLLGVNNVWADCGDVDVSYVRDLSTTINYILEQLNS